LTSADDKGQKGAADDLELVSWLCERIWVLQGHFTAEDGYAAARISIAEMLLTGTTCFLESMVCQLALPFSFLLILKLTSCSLRIDMVSMACVKRSRKAVFEDVSARS
jgi:cytosine/adenosine deaminase-related metal-dependent hydrolase